MRIFHILAFLCFISGCSPERKTRVKIESLEARDAKYEIGIECMQYILRHGDDLSYAKDLTRKLIDLGFFLEASFAVESLLDTHGNDADLYYLRGICYRKQHRYHHALADIMKAVRMKPEERSFVDEMQRVRQAQIVWNAIDSLNTAIGHPVLKAEVLLQRAEKLFSLQEYDAALYDLGSIAAMRSPTDSAYYARQVSSIYTKSKRPVETLSEMIKYFKSTQVSKRQNAP